LGTVAIFTKVGGKKSYRFHRGERKQILLPDFMETGQMGRREKH